MLVDGFFFGLGVFAGMIAAAFVAAVIGYLVEVAYRARRRRSFFFDIERGE